MANTTWNPADKAANIVLSNGNLTAASNSGAVGDVRSVTGKRLGKWYVEFTCTQFDSVAGTGVGIASPYGVLTNIWASPNLSVNASGTIYSAGVSTGLSIGAISNGDTISMAVDFTDRMVWFRRNGGSWNASSGTAYDPTVPSSGISLPAYAQYLAMGAGASGDSVTLNAGDSAFSYAVPSGYTAGWDTVDSTGPQNLGSVGVRNGNAGYFGNRDYSPAALKTTVSGIVSILGVPTAGVRVRAHAKKTGDMLGQALSAGDGSYSIECGGSTDVTVVAFPGPPYQAVVFDQVVPG